MAFTAQDVKELREITGCGMMDCKKALTETNGDKDKAIEFLREKGLATAAKKAGRIASEGIVKAYLTEDKKVGVLVEVNSETDFVAKNDEFQSFVSKVAEVIAVGPGGLVDGKEVTMFVKVGDKVITGKYSGTEVKIDGEEYTIVRQNDILAIVE